MGQKVNPHGLRVGIIKDWDSRWFADKKERLTAFHVWDDYTEETDMNEKINEMKLLIEPEIEEIFDWKCKNKFPYNYVKFGKKGLIPEAKIDRIYKKITK